MSPHPHPLVSAVAAAIDGLEGAARLLVGVSGGADSVALARALLEMDPHRDGRLVVAHLGHGLRAESLRDAEWVAQFAAELGAPCIIEHADVSRVAADSRVGIEEAARGQRYEFLQSAALECGCRYVAVAHTADDQAETILHHLVRGTGLAGLRGMPERRSLTSAMLIRPLLEVPRRLVLDYLESLGQGYLVDATNVDESFTRNRIRHTLLPLLQDQFNPRVVEALLRLGKQARETHEIVAEFAAELMAAAIESQEADRAVVQTEPLVAASRHLVREAFRVLFSEQHWPRQRMGFDDWDRLAELAQSSQSPKSLTLPEGITAHYRRGTVTLERH